MLIEHNHRDKNTIIVILSVLCAAVIFLCVILTTSNQSSNTIGFKLLNESKIQRIDNLKLPVIDPFILKDQSNNKYAITKIIKMDGLYYCENQIAQGGPGGTLNINEIEVNEITSNITDPSLLTYIGHALHTKINSPKQLEINRSYEVEPGKFKTIRAYNVYQKYKIEVEKTILFNIKHTDQYELLIATEIIFQ